MQIIITNFLYHRPQNFKPEKGAKTGKNHQKVSYLVHNTSHYEMLNVLASRALLKIMKSIDQTTARFHGSLF